MTFWHEAMRFFVTKIRCKKKKTARLIYCNPNTLILIFRTAVPPVEGTIARSNIRNWGRFNYSKFRSSKNLITVKRVQKKYFKIQSCIILYLEQNDHKLHSVTHNNAYRLKFSRLVDITVELCNFLKKKKNYTDCPGLFYYEITKYYLSIEPKRRYLF